MDAVRKIATGSQRRRENSLGGKRSSFKIFSSSSVPLSLCGKKNSKTQAPSVIR